MFNINVTSTDGLVVLYTCSDREEMLFLVLILDKSKKVKRITVTDRYDEYINPGKEHWNTTKVYYGLKWEQD